ncbi:MAG: hypothetical protein HGB14_00155, partial [Anaerolineaceae bacterium]|nr:hypothetical protein [Anaerolineaceae bacterium]
CCTPEPLISNEAVLEFNASSVLYTPGELSAIPALSKVQIHQLTQLATKVENFYKVPQDLEWAIAEDELYLLQTRPITSLFPLPSPKPADENLHIYFSFGHAQMNTNPISPWG